MSTYRRMRVPGHSYFFTVCVEERGSDVLIEHVETLRRAWAATLAEHPFRCDAAVVLPDHLHAVWTLPPGDSDFSVRWRKIKARFTRWSGRFSTISPSKQRKREAGLWQRRFWEHAIRDSDDFAAHVAYCWTNPVKHGLAARPEDWLLSSLHRDIRAGLVGPETVGTMHWSMGER